MAKGEPQDELEDTIPDPPEDLADEETEETEQPDDSEEEADEPGEPQDDPDSTSEEARQPERERPSGRADRRIAALQERLAETDRRLNEALTRVQPQQYIQQGESPEQRAQRLALLTPTERMEVELRESEARHESRLQAVLYQSSDASDKAAFQSRAAVDPVYRKWAPRVEAELAKLRNDPDPSKRANPQREVLLAYMVGKAALDGRTSKEGKTQKQQAARRVAGAQAKPANARSDAPTNRRSQQTSLERRLENIEL